MEAIYEGPGHHPAINQLKRLLTSYGIRCKYFNKQSLFIETVWLRGRVRKGFLVRYVETVVPGARWTVNYFVCLQHQRETLNVPSFSIHSMAAKLVKFGFLLSIELQSQQTKINL